MTNRIWRRTEEIKEANHVHVTIGRETIIIITRFHHSLASEDSSTRYRRKLIPPDLQRPLEIALHGVHGERGV